MATTSETRSRTARGAASAAGAVLVAGGLLFGGVTSASASESLAMHATAQTLSEGGVATNSAIVEEADRILDIGDGIVSDSVGTMDGVVGKIPVTFTCSAGQTYLLKVDVKQGYVTGAGLYGVECTGKPQQLTTDWIGKYTPMPFTPGVATATATLFAEGESTWGPGRAALEKIVELHEEQ